MEENVNKLLEIQTIILNIVKDQQVQVSDLKSYLDKENPKLYKDIILINKCEMLEEVYTKSEYRIKVENFLSLANSLGKIIDLNNSIKTILCAIKIFEEHEHFIKQMSIQKVFLHKIFEKNEMIPLIKNESLKNKYVSLREQSPQREFYLSLYKNDNLFWNDFNKYLSFQLDIKQTKSDFKFEDFSTKFSKAWSGSTVNYYKLYSRASCTFDLDYAEVAIILCDIIFMIYNKFSDKICYQQQMLEYINKLNNLIKKNFISIISDDLHKLAEYLLKKEIENFSKKIDKFI